MFNVCGRYRLFLVLFVQMPMGRFLLGVFLAPVALGLLFTPLFLMDMGGLSFDGTTLAATVAGEGPVAAATRRFSAMLNVFLYAYVLELRNSLLIFRPFVYAMVLA